MMCGKRLKNAIPIWLPHYKSRHEKLDSKIEEKLLSISAATIDRLLKSCKQIKRPHGISGTRPGYLLKNQIEIKTDHWDVNQSGFMEADTVAHCGSNISGDFIWSLTLIDIHTGWTELRAAWNKSSHAICEQISNIEHSLPFKLIGFDCDNGSEFLNHHLLRYLQERKEPVQFTRSRPYKKNDNAHVEQKNWTGVRHVFGYYRLDKKFLVGMMNDIYKNEWGFLLNFFYPSMQLCKKVKINSKYKRKYHQPMTAYQRILHCDEISESKKKELSMLHEKLNPFELRESLERKLKAIFSHVQDFKTNPRRKI